MAKFIKLTWDDEPYLLNALHIKAIFRCGSGGCSIFVLNDPERQDADYNCAESFDHVCQLIGGVE